MSDWRVPAAFLAANSGAPDLLAWARSAPAMAAEVASEWDLRSDGPALSGWMGVVWPVCDDDDRPLMLKLGSSPSASAREGSALEAWAGRGATVGLVRADADRGALLLNRLDPNRDLEHHPDADDATAVIGELLATQHSRLAGRPARCGRG